MKNPRLTAKERGLIKGAIRRVFSRSDLRRKVLDAGIVKHSDPKRKRVKTWVKCEQCNKPEAKSNIDIDHVNPVIPITSSLDQMTFDQLIDAIWCEEKNLRRLCHACHDIKTKAENKERRAFKKGIK